MTVYLNIGGDRIYKYRFIYNIHIYISIQIGGIDLREYIFTVHQFHPFGG